MSGRVNSPPDWKKCTCASIRPGMIQRPDSSTRLASWGTATSADRPTVAIRPPATTSTASSMGIAPVPSISVAPLKATLGSFAGAPCSIPGPFVAADRLTRGKVGREAEPDHVEPNIWRVAMAIRGAKAIGIVAPAAAPQDDMIRLAGEPARGPFPHVAGHVEEAGRRTSVWEAANRRGTKITIGGIGPAAGHGSKIGA